MIQLHIFWKNRNVPVNIAIRIWCVCVLATNRCTDKKLIEYPLLSPGKVNYCMSLLHLNI